MTIDTIVQCVGPIAFFFMVIRAMRRANAMIDPQRAERREMFERAKDRDRADRAARRRLARVLPRARIK
jgi:rRNA processing protein Gar1